MIKEIIDIIKSKNKKTIKDFEILNNFFITYDFFKAQKASLPLKLYFKLLTSIKLKKVNPGDFIVKYDDFGDRFYIILNSKVLVYIPNKTYSNTNKISYNKASNDIKDYNNKNLYYNKLDILNNLNILNGFNLIKILNPGESFGEYSLISNTKRSSTIACYSAGYLLYLEKDDFNQILLNNKIIAEKSFFSYLNSIYLIDETVYKSKSKGYLFYNFQKINIKRNNFLYKFNEPVDNMYFIISGEVLIDFYNNYNNINSLILKDKNIIGEEEYFENSTKRINQAKAISDIEAYVLNYKNINAIGNFALNVIIKNIERNYKIKKYIYENLKKNNILYDIKNEYKRRISITNKNTKISNFLSKENNLVNSIKTLKINKLENNTKIKNAIIKSISKNKKQTNNNDNKESTVYNNLKDEISKTESILININKKKNKLIKNKSVNVQKKKTNNINSISTKPLLLSYRKLPLVGNKKSQSLNNLNNKYLASLLINKNNNLISNNYISFITKL